MTKLDELPSQSKIHIIPDAIKPVTGMIIRIIRVPEIKMVNKGTMIRSRLSGIFL